MGKDPDVRVDQLFVVGEKMPIEVHIFILLSFFYKSLIRKGKTNVPGRFD